MQVLLKQAARAVQQCKEADARACQAAALVSERDSVIETFTQEHRRLLQLAEHFESTALEMQQRRAIAGNATHNLIYTAITIHKLGLLAPRCS